MTETTQKNTAVQVLEQELAKTEIVLENYIQSLAGTQKVVDHYQRHVNEFKAAIKKIGRA